MVKIKDEYKKFIIIIASDIFYISLTAFIFFSLIELARHRFVASYLNLNALLMLVVITGVITVVSRPTE
ncbi:hypothetical protein KAI52_01250 [Candidatus Parcubacteria bacterium]|nr:hypothetical protein [Candidatus Parcubacteria bacterium]